MRPTPTDTVDAEPEVETETLHAPVPEDMQGLWQRQGGASLDLALEAAAE